MPSARLSRSGSGMADRTTDRASPTVDQLRCDIDSGRTGDKVPAFDPASAPLGTDEEAAGTPVSAEALARAREIETSGPWIMPEGEDGLGYAWVLVGFEIAFAAIFIVAGLALRA